MADRLIHSSLIDGAKLSGAKLMRFLHNDVTHAKKILQENRSKFKKCIIITETVFSMDGDLGKIDEFVDAPGQDMVLILGQYGEILMPWHPDWIIDTDTEYNSVTVNLPDGFLDIYISP